MQTVTTVSSWKDVAEEAERWSAQEVLQWAAARFAPRITLATGFGAEGCVLIDMLARHGLRMHVFTLDTGLLFPGTYGLWRELEERYGLTIHGVRPAQTVRQQAEAHGDALWRREPGRCCELRKVVPLAGVLADRDAWVTAIRRDQTAARAGAAAIEWDARFGLVKVNPLVRWTKNQVWDYIGEHRVPYNPLHDRGFPSIGCHPCTSSVAAGESDRAGRWRGQNRTECGLHARTASVESGEAAAS
jgi:phosphoadenylyl-sulfate reductase (thioredoxin)